MPGNIENQLQTDDEILREVMRDLQEMGMGEDLAYDIFFNTYYGWLRIFRPNLRRRRLHKLYSYRDTVFALLPELIVNVLVERRRTAALISVVIRRNNVPPKIFSCMGGDFEWDEKELLDRELADLH
jgi:hypothetical protein